MDAADLINSAGQRLVPLLITAGSLLGFIAFAGAVIVWTRFEAVKVPPDQAVNAVSREELVSVGASLLLIFGFFGAIALVATYLVDRRGRATPGMARWLLCLLAIEGVTAVMLVEGISPRRAILFSGLVVLACLAGVGVTYVDLLTRLRDDFKLESSGLLAPVKRSLLHWSDDDSPWAGRGETIAALCALLVVGACASIALLLHPATAAMVALALLATVALVGLAVFAGRIVIDAREHLAKEKREEEYEQTPLGGARHRPYRLYMKPPGVVVLALLLGVMIAVPALVLKQWWLAASLGAAVILIAGLWRIAALPDHGFRWFGLAVFLSVPLFGTLTLMARNLAHPQVQPLALIRKTDGPYEAIQGLYVAEGDERVYFANVATEGCTETVTPNSGRLLWVPKSELVALSVGPAENLADAGRTALEMSYALTPGVETPIGGQTELTVGEKHPKHDRRLEGAGRAVRPNFGVGLSLSPEEASPGQVVTLRMSAPNKNPEVMGFGEVRGGRTLRVGGVRANIVKEPASEAHRAEYVETRSGQVLHLAKQEPYVKVGEDEYEPLQEAPWLASKGKYVKLTDPAALTLDGKRRTGDAFYLPLVGNVRPAELAGRPEVELHGAEEAGLLSLRPHPLTQAWYENRIKFRVPENASSAPVTVECNQLAGEPLLRVSRPPVARIGVSVQTGTDHLLFDSRRSVAAGSKIAHRRWVVNGLPRGHRKWLRLGVPARYAPYRVRLYTTSSADSGGETDIAEVSVLRLPVAALRPGSKHGAQRKRWFRRIRHALERTARIEHPVEVDVNGFFADGTGGAEDDARLSLHWADIARRRLLSLGSGLASTSSTLTEDGPYVQPTVPVKIRAFGHSCPAAGDAGGEDRVEVFLLEDGAKLTNSAGCSARRTDSAEWLPPR